MRRHLAALLLATSLLATACGSDDPPEADSGQPDKVTVGVIPILDVAPIYLGKAKGFFEKHDIELTLKQAEGGAAIVPAVVSKEYQFGFSNIISLLLAKSQGLPIKVVSNGTNSTGEDGKDFAGLYVRADSGITSAKDLEGKTVAANTLQNIVDTSVRASVRKAGGDPTKVRFTALPFPEQPAALKSGQVDAVFVVEPFQQAVLADGAKLVASSYVDAAEDLCVALYFTSEQLLAENPDLVGRFTDAMKESLSYADSHPDETREVIGSYTKIDPATIERLTLPKYPADINRDSIETMADLATEDGLLTDSVDLNALLP
ncbi:ABC transporter substrate-binding protein [Actinophytocola oryzae]|uniref:NitT/TauT family transport system substrate-binding protein n=1 Tax=Actinophytocola oryzae TaxID=502181 RepID=A0A4R7VV99_9PSEU|nr:ABC transporter substrate-binding protein [Actinophytocola oryzae]TDV53804.1 NitT/TauT family transport system substrate-binding protein [Actinophytocola oryzae]